MVRGLVNDVLKSLVFAVAIVIFLFAFSVGLTHLLGRPGGITPRSEGVIAGIFFVCWFVVFIILRRDGR